MSELTLTVRFRVDGLEDLARFLPQREAATIYDKWQNDPLGHKTVVVEGITVDLRRLPSLSSFSIPANVRMPDLLEERNLLVVVVEGHAEFDADSVVGGFSTLPCGIYYSQPTDNGVQAEVDAYVEPGGYGFDGPKTVYTVNLVGDDVGTVIYYYRRLRCCERKSMALTEAYGGHGEKEKGE